MTRDLRDFIMVTEPVLEKAALDEIIGVTEGVEWRVPTDGGDGIYRRTCTTFPISGAVVGHYPSPPGRLDRIKKVDEVLLAATLRALKFYKAKFDHVRTQSDSGFDLLKYEVGQAITPHIDDRTNRVLSMSVALNDEYTGGEFRFWKDDEVIYRLAPGAVIMFPSNFMYSHEILPVVSGTRYAMITWFS